MNEKQDNYQFIIPAVIFAVVVSIIGGFLAVQGANQLTSSGLTATSAAIGTGASMGADGTITTTGAINTAGGVILNTAGATYGLLVPNGNVGMGTMTPDPAYALDVNGKIRSSSGGFVFPDGTTQITAGGSGSLPSGTSGQMLRHDGTNWVADSVIYNNGTNVGIGTTAPGVYKLNVSGSMNATTLYQNGSNVQIRIVNTCVAGSAIRSIDAFGNVTCESTSSTGDGLGTGNTGTTGYIPKWTTNNTILGNSIIQESSSAIAIGTLVDPNTKLTVQGTNGGIAGYASGASIGVYGSSGSGVGVRGNSISGQGVYGSGSTQGVTGYSSAGSGIYGSTATGWAGYFSGNTYFSGNAQVTGQVLMGYEIVTSTGSNNTVTAICTSPRKVLAGGCSFDVNGYRSSAPNTAIQDRWNCYNPLSTATTAYAICARIGN